MTRLVFDVYPPPTDTSIASGPGLLVRLSASPYTGSFSPLPVYQLQEGTTYFHGKPMGRGTLVIDKDSSALTETNFAVGNYVVVRDLDLEEEDDTLNVIGGFFMEEGDFTLVSDDPKVLTFSGRSTISVLDRALMSTEAVSPASATPENDIVDGYWDFGNDVYGGVMRRAIIEANGQRNDPGDPVGSVPGLPMIDVSISGALIVGDGAQWDDSEDSNGDPWPSFDGRYRVQCGTNLLELYRELYNFGVELEIDAFTFNMFAYNPDGYGEDLTGGAFGAGVVRLEAGVNIASDLTRSIHGRLRTTHIMVRTTDHPEGGWIEDDDYSPGDPVYKRLWQSGDISGEPSEFEDRAQRNIDLRGTGEDGIRIPLHITGNDPENGIYQPGPHYDGGAHPGPTATSGHLWTGDLVTVHTGTGEWDYNNASKRIEAVEYLLRDAGDWDVVLHFGPVQWMQNSDLIPVGGSVGENLPIQLCQALTVTEGSTGRWYFTDTSRTLRAASAIWDGGTGDMIARVMSHTPGGAADSFSSWDAVNQADSSWGLLQGGFVLSNPADLAAVQAGGTFRIQMRIGVRHGIGIDEASHLEKLEGTIRVYRPGTSSYIGTMVSDEVGSVYALTDPGGTLSNRSLAGVAAGVPGAVSTDEVIVELGLQHEAPNTGGAGGSVWWNDSAASDLPEDDSTTDNLRSWMDLRTSSTISGTGLNPDLVGTSVQAARCDHKDHVWRDRLPTVDDDTSLGYPNGTLWIYVDDLDSPTEVIAVYQLFDNTNGAAVWLPWPTGTTGTPGTSLTIEEEDASPTGVFEVLKVPNGTLTDNGDGSASLDYAAGSHAHEPPTPGIHKILIQRTTNYTSSNTNDSIPDFDTVLEDTMTDSWWDAGAPDRLVVTADYDGLDAVFTAKAAVADSGANDFLELKMYRFPVGFGEPRPLDGTMDAYLITVEQQPAQDNINHFIETVSDPITVHTGDVILLTLRSSIAMTYITYENIDTTLGAYIVATPGEQGEPGEGVPTGGTAGQVLTKQSGTDFDTDWETPSSSSTVTGQILISDTPSTPLVFGDLLQNEAQDDLIYADP